MVIIYSYVGGTTNIDVVDLSSLRSGGSTTANPVQNAAGQNIDEVSLSPNTLQQILDIAGGGTIT